MASHELVLETHLLLLAGTCLPPDRQTVAVFSYPRNLTEYNYSMYSPSSPFSTWPPTDQPRTRISQTGYDTDTEHTVPPYDVYPSYGPASTSPDFGCFLCYPCRRHVNCLDRPMS
ncbi:hypothetical protein BJ875DRAFT_447570 [Amylocarpus encephaloides]|uniref:Uncharacterized protein n=1 Tax=Amylocarpus encephaloides TaxID=45428 RepID=A0A9P8CC05_9HELO|nr:hypothetical protein BJ875DRAFT_447570 [Amylocarpus encephaloides]